MSLLIPPDAMARLKMFCDMHDRCCQEAAEDAAPEPAAQLCAGADRSLPTESGLDG